MRVLRVIGVLLVLAALALLAREAWVWHETGRWTIVSAGKLWFELHKDSLQLAQPAIERHVWAPLWDPAILTVLQWPAWALTGGLGLLLLLLAQLPRRRRRIFR